MTISNSKLSFFYFHVAYDGSKIVKLTTLAGITDHSGRRAILTKMVLRLKVLCLFVFRHFGPAGNHFKQFWATSPSRPGICAEEGGIPKNKVER